ncbi:MAG: glycosyltransferase [Sediminibacterium sp.]|jgi:glycosyltransferase involved in cell wall biosynthesis|nr:glycosyltransferase [Sediminibacterium sp.]
MTLKALDRQTLPAPLFEIIVVDDGGERDRVPRVLDAADMRHAVKVVSSEKGGVSAARNRGAREARASLLLFLDDDTLLSYQGLEAHCAAHEVPQRMLAHGDVLDLIAFMAAPDGDFPCDRIEGLGGRSITLADVYELESTGPRQRTQVSFIERAAAAVARRPDRYRACAWLLCIGTNTSLRAEDFWQAGGFNVAVGREWGGEDLELGIRLHSRHLPLRLIQATGYHLPETRDDISGRLLQVWRAIASIYGNPLLERTADFLAGDLTLDALEALLRAGAAAGLQSDAAKPTTAHRSDTRHRRAPGA